MATAPIVAPLSENLFPSTLAIASLNVKTIVPSTAASVALFAGTDDDNVGAVSSAGVSGSSPPTASKSPVIATSAIPKYLPVLVSEDEGVTFMVYVPAESTTQLASARLIAVDVILSPSLLSLDTVIALLLYLEVVASFTEIVAVKLLEPFAAKAWLIPLIVYVYPLGIVNVPYMFAPASFHAFLFSF